MRIWLFALLLCVPLAKAEELLPQIKSTMGENNWRRVAVSGNLIIALTDNGLVLIDGTDATNPSFEGRFKSVFSDGFAIHSSMVVLYSQSYGIQLVDISDPSNPTLLSTYTIDFSQTGSLYGVYLFGDRAYLALRYRIETVDISDRTQPTFVSSINNPNSSNLNWRSSQLVAGFGAAFYYGLDGYVFDVSDPDLPVIAGQERPDGRINEIHAMGSILYLAGEELQIIDMDDIQNPVTLGSRAGVAHVSVQGDLAFATRTNSEGLEVLDISDPSQPKPSLTSPLLTGSLAAYGDTLVYANKDVTVEHVAGFLDTATLVSKTTWGTNYYFQEMLVHGDHLYVATTRGGYGDLYVFDLSNPDQPTEVHQQALEGFCADMQMIKGHLVVSGHSGLEIFDVSQPAAPVKVGVTFPINVARRMIPNGDTLYVTSMFSGLVVVDITDITQPVLVANISLTDTAAGLVIDSTLYLAREGDLSTFDISDPHSPVLHGVTGVGGGIDKRLYYIDGFLYSGTAISGYDLTDPLYPVWLSIEPYFMESMIPFGETFLIGGNRMVNLNLEAGMSQLVAKVDWTATDLVQYQGRTYGLNAHRLLVMEPTLCFTMEDINEDLETWPTSGVLNLIDQVNQLCP